MPKMAFPFQASNNILLINAIAISTHIPLFCTTCVHSTSESQQSLGINYCSHSFADFFVFVFVIAPQLTDMFFATKVNVGQCQSHLA
jgi:hypothetical protein